MNHSSFLAVVFAACMTAAGAYAAPTTSTPAVNGVMPAAFKTAGEAGGKVTSVDATVRATKDSASEQSEADDSDWRSYGMVLGTLVLMGIIAVRRQRS